MSTTKNVRFYNSPDQFLEDVTGDEWQLREGCDKSSTRKEKSDDDWAGSATYARMIELMQGEMDMSQAEKISEQLDRVQKAVTNSVVYDVQGSYVDIGAFLSGEPEHMVDFTEQKNVGKYATFIFNQCEGAGVSAEKIMAKAGICTTLIDALESQGVRCQVFLCIASDNYLYKTQDYALIKIKDYESYISVNQMTSFHVSFFRRAWFAYQEKYYRAHCGVTDEKIKNSRKRTSGYGRVIRADDMDESLIKEYCGVEEGDNFFLNDSITNSSSMSKAADAVINNDIEYMAEYVNSFIDRINE